MRGIEKLLRLISPFFVAGSLVGCQDQFQEIQALEPQPSPQLAANWKRDDWSSPTPISLRETSIQTAIPTLTREPTKRVTGTPFPTKTSWPTETATPESTPTATRIPTATLSPTRRPTETLRPPTLTPTLTRIPPTATEVLPTEAQTRRPTEVSTTIPLATETVIFTAKPESQSGLRRPDVSQIPLPEIISKIPPFPSDISIHTPGYWPDTPWGEHQDDKPGSHYHSWMGIFGGVLGIDGEGRVHVKVDLDIGEAEDWRTAVLPVSSQMPVRFVIQQTPQGESPIFETGDPQAVYSVLSQDNWFREDNQEPIIVAIRDDVKGQPPHIKVIATRAYFQGW